MIESILIKMLDAIQRENGAQEPIAVHISGTVSYIIYPLITAGVTSGYPVKRITEPTANQAYWHSPDNQKKTIKNGNIFHAMT